MLKQGSTTCWYEHDIHLCHERMSNVCMLLSQPDRSWEVDIEHLEQQIDSQTAAIVIVNPSNPCGSVFTRKHIEDIIAVAERHHLPIIADETYAWMVSIKESASTT